MKRLTILRHAKSDWGDPGVDDFDRPLNDRGRLAARRIGAVFKSRGMSFTLVLASTARRVRETLDGVAETYGALPIRFDEDLYLASEPVLLDKIRGAPEADSSLLLVGHNPGLERLVVDLAQDDDHGLRNRVIGGLPTAAAAVLEVHVEKWTDVMKGQARFAELILPRDLD